ncbi:cytochrome P450 [Marasmius fiardii PR-910]|nr:cytochrome P450 [Marasmius fiardii PR-910]
MLNTLSMGGQAFIPWLFCLSLAFVLYWKTRKTLPLPPGPPAKLISGNIHQLQGKEPWKLHAKWSEGYGPVTQIRVYTQRIIVLNTAKAVLDLLESRSSIYSDRPVVWMYKELVGRKLAVFNISSFHPRFRKYRTLLRSALSSREMVQRYQTLQDRDSVVLLRLLYQVPEKFIEHFRRNAGSVILEIAYGWPVKGEDDYLVSLMKESFELQAQLVQPGRWLVDTFPLLRFIPSWFPGGSFHHKARESREKLAPVDQFPHNWAKEQIASGNYVSSFTSMQLQEERDSLEANISEEEEDIIRWCSAALYAGGADTTVSVMTSFFLVMTLYPAVQRRAQDEIDAVVGRERLPDIDDRSALPYVNALIKEIMRWAPVVPQGLPHRVTEDDDYMGYRIPKGATVFANIWAIMRDPALYSDPMVFDPTRFLPNNGLDTPEPDPRKFAFGFGRRVCPGAQFAEDALFFNISRILATFDVRKAVGEDGKEISPEIKFSSTITSHAKPFPCRIVLRKDSAGERLLSGL